ncbi:hypothetical protein A2U01_0105954, partial [Trifolium medium]|nr:hypothetical protein [Trifolium medium]
GDKQRPSHRMLASNWRLLAITCDNVASPRPGTLKNVAWRLQERRPTTARRAECSVAV